MLMLLSDRPAGTRTESIAEELTGERRVNALLEELADAYHAIDCLLDHVEFGGPLDFGGHRIPDRHAKRLMAWYEFRASGEENDDEATG